MAQRDSQLHVSVVFGCRRPAECCVVVADTPAGGGCHILSQRRASCTSDDSDGSVHVAGALARISGTSPLPSFGEVGDAVGGAVTNFLRAGAGLLSMVTPGRLSPSHGHGGGAAAELPVDNASAAEPADDAVVGAPAHKHGPDMPGVGGSECNEADHMEDEHAKPTPTAGASGLATPPARDSPSTGGGWGGGAAVASSAPGGWVSDIEHPAVATGRGKDDGMVTVDAGGPKTPPPELVSLAVRKRSVVVTGSFMYYEVDIQALSPGGTLSVGLVLTQNVWQGSGVCRVRGSGGTERVAQRYVASSERDALLVAQSQAPLGSFPGSCGYSSDGVLRSWAGRRMRRGTAPQYAGGEGQQQMATGLKVCRCSRYGSTLANIVDPRRSRDLLQAMWLAVASTSTPGLCFSRTTVDSQRRLGRFPSFRPALLGL